MTTADRAKLFAARLGEDQNTEDENTPKQSKFGITVRKVTPEMADRLDMEAGKGVIVQDVKPGVVCRRCQSGPRRHYSQSTSSR